MMTCHGHAGFIEKYEEQYRWSKKVCQKLTVGAIAKMKQAGKV